MANLYAVSISEVQLVEISVRLQLWMASNVIWTVPLNPLYHSQTFSASEQCCVTDKAHILSIWRWHNYMWRAKGQLILCQYFVNKHNQWHDLRDWTLKLQASNYCDLSFFGLLQTSTSRHRRPHANSQSYTFTLLRHSMQFIVGQTYIRPCAKFKPVHVKAPKLARLITLLTVINMRTSVTISWMGAPSDTR